MRISTVKKREPLIKKNTPITELNWRDCVLDLQEEVSDCYKQILDYYKETQHYKEILKANGIAVKPYSPKRTVKMSIYKSVGGAL